MTESTKIHHFANENKKAIEQIETKLLNINNVKKKCERNKTTIKSL